MLSVFTLSLAFPSLTIIVFFGVLWGWQGRANVPHRKSKSQHNKEGILDKATPTWLTIFFLFLPAVTGRHLLFSPPFACSA